MKRNLGDIWEEENPVILKHPWRLQLKNYVAQFTTKEAAELYWAVTEKIKTGWNR